MPTVTLANGRRFEAEAGMSVLDAALAQGVTLEHSCRSGRCNCCKARVVAGRSRPLHDEPALSAHELADGWVLTCTREATSDLTLDIEDVAMPGGIVPKTLPSRIDTLDLQSSDVLKVVLRLPPNAGLAFVPGQYLDVSGPGGIKRSYSIASGASQTDKLELHVKRYKGGAMSDYWFSHAKVNDLLRFRGPLGAFFLREVAGRDLVFLATGTGYAPIRSMLMHLALPTTPRPKSIRLFWGGRVREDVYANPVALLDALQFVPVLSRANAAWGGARGHVQDVFLTTGCPLDDAAVYACGSQAMVESARATLMAAGLPAQRYFADAFVSSTSALHS